MKNWTIDEERRTSTVGYPIDPFEGIVGKGPGDVGLPDAIVLARRSERPVNVVQIVKIHGPSTSSAPMLINAQVAASEEPVEWTVLPGHGFDTVVTSLGLWRRNPPRSLATEVVSEAERILRTLA